MSENSFEIFNRNHMETLVAVVAHCLGLLGMAGVWLVPARVFHVVARLRHGTHAGTASTVAALLNSLALVFSFIVASDALPRVFKCLWSGWCTATRGGALLNLALFGLSVLVMELVWFGGRRFISSTKAAERHVN